jgi:hypothetical protein
MQISHCRQQYFLNKLLYQYSCNYNFPMRVLLLLLQVVLQAVDALVAANADNVLRAGYKKVRQIGHVVYADADGAAAAVLIICCIRNAEQQHC